MLVGDPGDAGCEPAADACPKSNRRPVRADRDGIAALNAPLGRIAESEECANLVTMLASPLMHMVNGTMIEIDGGQEKALMDRLRDRK